MCLSISGLKRLKGLNKVKLVDAVFVWTEPHSKRLKVKVTVQQEVCIREAFLGHNGTGNSVIIHVGLCEYNFTASVRCGICCCKSNVHRLSPGRSRPDLGCISPSAPESEPQENILLLGTVDFEARCSFPMLRSKR